MTSNYRLYCAVFGCLNSSITKPHLTFFRLPGQPSRISEWLFLIGRDDLANKTNIVNYRVCENHFDEETILPTTNRKILKKNAVPSLNLPGFKRKIKKEETDPRNKDKQTQTENTVNASHAQTLNSHSCNNPMKRKLENKVSEPSKKLKLYTTENKIPKAEKSTFRKLCDTFLTNELALLVKAQANLKLDGKTNRYDTDYIIFCLNLYIVSPRAYQFLQSALGLPCTTTLYKHSIPITTEINEKALSILKMKVEQMTEAEKKCSILINAIKLKKNLFYHIREDKIIGFHEVGGLQSPEPAKIALIIMVRGIFSDWKQLIAYVLISDCTKYEEITKWVDEVLEKLLSIGLDIRTFVSALNFNLWNAAKARSVSIEKPYFFIKNRKIYYIFDAPNLIKDIRNNFMEYDFHFGNSVAKYEHIVQFYRQEHEKESSKLTSKLTNSHINPTKLEKTKICYATQLLSKSVAIGICTSIHNKDIDESGTDTAKFIKMMSDLFNCLNSSNLRHNHEYKKAYAGFESQTTFFSEMIIFFQELKLINPKNGYDLTSKAIFIQGFQITIKSILHLFEDLRMEGYPFLSTKRLNLEVLENVFSQIQTKNGLAVRPTSWQFISAFKKIYFKNIIKPTQRGICADGLGKLLVQTIDKTHNTDDPISNSSLEIKTSEYNQLNMPEKNSLFYICGYLLKRCGEKHNDCLVLKSYMNPDQTSHNFNTSDCYLRYREFIKNNLQTLVVPSDDFVEYVEAMEKIFRTTFKRKNVEKNIFASIYEQVKEIPFSPPCSCFPTNFLMKLFIRMRLYFTLKFINKAFRISQERRKICSVADLQIE